MFKLNRRKLLRLVAEKKLTQVQLAELAGIADSTVRRILTRNQSVQLVTAGKLAAALGVDIFEILDDKCDN